MAAWELLHEGRVLAADAEIGPALGSNHTKPIAVLLRRRIDSPFESGLGAPDEQILETDDYGDDFDCALVDSELAAEEASGVAEALEEEEGSAVTACEASVRTKTRQRTVPRRATVRHYSRMNPERVYPLVVLLTKDMVRQIAQNGVAQKTSRSFRAKVDAAVEIEPVLPGCACYPPRATTRLGKDDVSLTFHVVPHVLGEVTGAKVLVRQDHRTLAEVELEIKVTQKTLVYCFGVFTFLLPFLSSILKHFRLDFDSQRETGFSLYLALAKFVFDNVSPFNLTAALGLLTACAYYFTRPRVREAIWDLELLGPDETLAEIKQRAGDNAAGAARDLADLLQTYPDYQPARLYLATLHYQQKRHAPALAAFEAAFRLGPAEPVDYLRASLTASRLGQHSKALSILQIAVATLPTAKITGVMWYNLACYHARLGQLNEVIPFLRKAVYVGYRKLESYHNDPDLNPVRHLMEFKSLVAQLQR